MHILIHSSHTGTRLMRPKGDEDARAIVQDMRHERIASTTGFSLVDDKGNAHVYDRDGNYIFTIDHGNMAGKQEVPAGCACSACVFKLYRSRCLVCGGQADAKFPFCGNCAGRIKPADWKASTKACPALHGLLWAVTQPISGGRYRVEGHVSIKTFHGEHAKRVAKAMFKVMGVATVLEIKHNPAGDGVAGEVIARGLYNNQTGVEICLRGADILYPQPEGPTFLYRSLRKHPRQLNRWDSGVNRYLPYRSLADFTSACNMIARETRA